MMSHSCTDMYWTNICILPMLPMLLWKESFSRLCSPLPKGLTQTVGVSGFTGLPHGQILHLLRLTARLTARMTATRTNKIKQMSSPSTLKQHFAVGQPGEQHPVLHLAPERMLLIAHCSDEIFLEMAEAQMCCRDIWTFCCLMKSIDCWILPEPRYPYDSKESKMAMRVDIFSKVGKCGWTERLSDRSLRCLSSPSAKNQDAISTIHPDYSNTSEFAIIDIKAFFAQKLHVEDVDKRLHYRGIMK